MMVRLALIRRCVSGPLKALNENVGTKANRYHWARTIEIVAKRLPPRVSIPNSFGRIDRPVADVGRVWWWRRRRASARHLGQSATRIRRDVVGSGFARRKDFSRRDAV